LFLLKIGNNFQGQTVIHEKKQTSHHNFQGTLSVTCSTQTSSLYEERATVVQQIKHILLGSLINCVEDLMLFDHRTICRGLHKPTFFNYQTSGQAWPKPMLAWVKTRRVVLGKAVKTSAHA